MSQPVGREATVWTWADLGYFLGAIFPSLLVAGLLSGWMDSAGMRGLTYQAALYVLLLSVLYVLATVRHGLPLGTAVNWVLPFPHVARIIFAAPLLAMLVSAAGVLLRAPLIPSAIDQLTAIDVPLPVVAVFAVMLGPIFEELVFRGFLQPLLAARLGRGAGVGLTAAAFSLLHGAQNQWLWQYLLLLFLAGAAFGVVRARTGSTAAACLLHAGFNLTQLTAAIAARG
jgi:membrane protease YdiL (CAAX protease family)